MKPRDSVEQLQDPARNWIHVVYGGQSKVNAKRTQDAIMLRSRENAPDLIGGWKRLTAGSLGVLLMLLPLGLYAELRLGLIGPPRTGATGFDFVFASFSVLGGILLLSAILNRWLVISNIVPVNPRAPDADRIVSTSAVIKKANPTKLKLERPPFSDEAHRGPVAWDEVDEEFAEAARAYVLQNYNLKRLFSDSVISVYKSDRKGRPNWYFHVQIDDAQALWIKVPHAGRRGGGPGLPLV